MSPFSSSDAPIDEDPSGADGPPQDSEPKEDPETKLEEVARARFGLRGSWDRVALYRETAEAATDTDLPFWLVLLLSGAIATLGLALNQTAVVIGAMLIAPLLGPLLGLSLALAVGDGRLAVQTSVTLLLGVVGVVGVAAVLTLILPFQNVTPEILARTRPTTLDLAIAVFSGIAGAVVTLSREKRLSASIPGVAIAVALIPPLGVAGFGIGAGMQGALIKGSLLLFGANLAGIVLSGMLAFLLVGMHRPDVIEAARRWHRDGEHYGLSARIETSPFFSRVRVFESAWARVALVLAFVIAVAVPLSTSLRQFIRETRVQSAVSAAVSALQADGRASVISRDVVLGPDGSEVELRIATVDWVENAERERLQQAASAAAREPVTIRFEQLLASDGELNELAEALPRTASTPIAASRTVSPSATMARLQRQLTQALNDLALPDGVEPLGASLQVSDAQLGVQIAYAAEAPLPAAAASMMARQAAAILGLDPERVSTEAVSLARKPLPVDSLVAIQTASVLGRYPSLDVVVMGDSVATAAAGLRFVAAGVEADRITVQDGAPSGFRLARTE